jgi:energy-coupling factor transporter transmembrane protein EcfT
MHKSYTILMSLELASIGIKYQGLNTNPFQQSSPTILLFLTALFCHVVSSTADSTLPITMVIFHISGVVGCETLLWILLLEFWNWYIINLFLVLVTSFCYFNCIHNITTKLFLPSPTHSTASLISFDSSVANAHPPNPEPQEGSV